MTHDEKINYMRIASGIVGYGFNNEQLDMIVSLYELVVQKKGKTCIDSVVKVEHEVKYRSDVQSRKDLLDKVSEKVSA